jgi:hypothetical protein
MQDANLNCADITPRVQTSPLPLLFVGAAALALLAGAAALWWRFGEGVYLTSLMSAVIACF